MSQRISVLVNDFRELQSLIQDLKSSGIPLNEIELIHKRTENLRAFFITPSETPRISDKDVTPILRSSDIADEDVRYCEMRVDNGATLLTVNVPDNQVDRVLSIMKQHRVSIPTDKDAPIGQLLRKGQTFGNASTKDLTKMEKIESIRVKVSDLNPKGYDVKDPEGNKIGDIKYLVGNPSTGQPYFVIVDVGGLFKDKLIVLPFDSLRFDLEEKEVIVPFDKEQVKGAPNFTEKELDYTRFSSYWDQLVGSEEFASTRR